jgi:hypothetical protein
VRSGAGGEIVFTPEQELSDDLDKALRDAGKWFRSWKKRTGRDPLEEDPFCDRSTPKPVLLRFQRGPVRSDSRPDRRRREELALEETPHGLDGGPLE